MIVLLPHLCVSQRRQSPPSGSIFIPEYLVDSFLPTHALVLQCISVRVQVSAAVAAWILAAEASILLFSSSFLSFLALMRTGSAAGGVRQREGRKMWPALTRPCWEEEAHMAPYLKPRHEYTNAIQAVGQAYKSRADRADREMNEDIEEGPARATQRCVRRTMNLALQ